MKNLSNIHVVGRILFGLVFLLPAFNKIGNFENVSKYMESVGMPIPSVLLVGAIVFLLAGSAAIITGYKIKIGVLLLLAFLIPATLIFHNDLSDQNQFAHCLKNVGLIASLLLIYSSEKFPKSLFNK